MIDGQPLACFQPFIDTATGRIAGVEALGRLLQADGRMQSVGPLFAEPKTASSALRRLDRQIRDNALSRLHEAPPDWFLSLNISPRWISRLRA
ncbi:EAL domain-containing protein, partial [Pseudomonas sp. MAFF 302030]|nr:EAL domain-containing protein [Pseudomonas morbosilactucae]